MIFSEIIDKRVFIVPAGVRIFVDRIKVLDTIPWWGGPLTLLSLLEDDKDVPIWLFGGARHIRSHIVRIILQPGMKIRTIGCTLLLEGESRSLNQPLPPSWTSELLQSL